MLRGWSSIAICVLAVIANAQEPLPQSDGADSLDIEPPLLIKDGKPLAPLANPESQPGDPQQLAAALERARKSAAAGERLYRAGIIAKVQAEDRALKVVRLESELANAKLEAAKAELSARQERFDRGEIPREEIDDAATIVASAEQAASAATAAREKADLEAAEANLRRQQKLLALGSGRKADVNRAAEKLSSLTETKE